MMKASEWLVLVAAGVMAPAVVVGQDEGAAPAAAEASGDFESEAARRAYAVGMFFAQRAQTALEQQGGVDAESLVEGVNSVLGAETSKSFDYGAFIGLDLKRNEVEVDPAGVAEGMAAFFAGGEAKLDEAGVQAAMNELRDEMQQRAAAKREAEQAAWDKQLAEEAPKNKAEGEKFLAENAGKDGVVTTDSGLQYQVLAGGEGTEKPSATDRVVVKYKGTLLDGTVFDDSKGAERTFAANRVIKGWTEGLQLMTKGSTFRFWIPGDLAYGMTPRAGGKIGAMDTLVFDVELVDIKKAPVVATPPVSIKDAKPAPTRKPITAVTPPVAVEIPPRKDADAEGEKEGEGEGEKPESE